MPHADGLDDRITKTVSALKKARSGRARRALEASLLALMERRLVRLGYGSTPTKRGLRGPVMQPLPAMRRRPLATSRAPARARARGCLALVAAVTLLVALLIDRWLVIEDGAIVLGLLKEKLGPSLHSKSWFFFEASDISRPNAWWGAATLATAAIATALGAWVGIRALLGLQAHRVARFLPAAFAATAALGWAFSHTRYASDQVRYSRGDGGPGLSFWMSVVAVPLALLAWHGRFRDERGS